HPLRAAAGPAAVCAVQRAVLGNGDRRRGGCQGGRLCAVRTLYPGSGAGDHDAAGRHGHGLPYRTSRSQGHRMTGIPMEHGLALADVLFRLGLAALMIRRHILHVLMSLEIMMNAAALAFVVAGARWGEAAGQVMFLLVMTLAAAEASMGLAILLQLYRRFRTLDIDAASEMRG